MSSVTSRVSSSRCADERLAEREDGAGPLRHRHRRPVRLGGAGGAGGGVDVGRRRQRHPGEDRARRRVDVVDRLGRGGLDPRAADVVLQRLGFVAVRSSPLAGASVSGSICVSPGVSDSEVRHRWYSRPAVENVVEQSRPPLWPQRSTALVGWSMNGKCRLARPDASRASAATASGSRRGARPKGDAPGWRRAIRTGARRPDPEAQRRVEDRAASPSIPAGTGSSASTAKSVAVHSRHGRCSARRPPRPCGAPTTVMPSRPSSIRGRVPEPDRPAEPVAVVRDEDRDAGAMLVAARPGPAQVEPGAIRVRASPGRSPAASCSFASR